MENNNETQKEHSDLVVFKSPVGKGNIELMYDSEMFWFSQKMIAKLFETSVSNVNKHLQKMQQMSNLQKKRTIEYRSIVQKEGNRDIHRKVAFYHLDTAIAVGFHINTHRANRIKQWAAQKLSEYIQTAGNQPQQQLPAAEPYPQDISMGDALIHCEIAGSAAAPVLVLLHGNGENLHIFDAQIGYFSHHYRVIAVDTRGHGQSTRGTAPFNYYTFANDLVATLDALQIDKAHIVGFSDGAITALHTALTAPERVASMVLLGVNCNTKGIRWLSRLLILLMYANLSVASLFSAKMRQRKEIWGLMVYQPNLSIAELSRITVSTLVVTGENDLVRQRHIDEISRAITGAKRLIIPGGNHFWMFKQPETLNRCVMEFIDECRSKSN